MQEVEHTLTHPVLSHTHIHTQDAEGLVFFKRTQILSEDQFTKLFIEFAHCGTHELCGTCRNPKKGSFVEKDSQRKALLSRKTANSTAHESWSIHYETWLIFVKRRSTGRAALMMFAEM